MASSPERTRRIMRIAVIADIHGNLPALEAVLADIACRAVDRTINLGDCVSGPLWPRECAERLAVLPMLTVRGNHDRWVAGPDPTSLSASDRFAHGELARTQRDWLAALPMIADAGDGILAFHATPHDDNRYLIEDIHEGSLIRASLETIDARLGETDARIVLCAHSHFPHLIRLRDGRWLLNPGSVGCPAYDDPDGEPHVSEAGSPHARYGVLTVSGETVSVEQIALRYDWDSAASRADRFGRPSWAHALRTGFMPGAE
jgi:predicted phosphodiesterase